MFLIDEMKRLIVSIISFSVDWIKARSGWHARLQLKQEKEKFSSSLFLGQAFLHNTGLD